MECHRNIEVIWLVRALKPDFKTIADFRRDKALSRSRVLLVNREARSKTAWRKINDLGNSLSWQIPSKIAYSWPV
jgi:transposase